MISNVLLRFDLFLWNNFIPKMNVGFFKSKFNSVLAILYISVYKLPRKFLVHYFFGKGNPVIVDSQKLISSNSLVLNKLIVALQDNIDRKSLSGSLNICQTDVCNPNYKYSIGSFNINYSVENKIIKLHVLSNYRFQESPDRITKHLHHWLFALKQKGKANDFKITGTEWITDWDELLNLKAAKAIPKTLRIKVLV